MINSVIVTIIEVIYINTYRLAYATFEGVWTKTPHWVASENTYTASFIDLY